MTQRVDAAMNPPPMKLLARIAITAIALALSAGFASAQRIALVIGNSSYRPGFELRNPVADARAIGRILSGLGFKVTTVMDTDLATAQRALDAFVPDGIAA
ncbi:MAG: caspase family protein, partial [Parvibaculaceae bacterium]